MEYTEEQIGDIKDYSYIEGRKASLIGLLRYVMRELGQEDYEALDKAVLALELEETKQQLRNICYDLGCNSWPDNLYLPDVVEKYLARTIREELDL